MSSSSSEGGRGLDLGEQPDRRYMLELDGRSFRASICMEGSVFRSRSGRERKEQDHFGSDAVPSLNPSSRPLPTVADLTPASLSCSSSTATITTSPSSLREATRVSSEDPSPSTTNSFSTSADLTRSGSSTRSLVSRNLRLYEESICWKRRRGVEEKR